MPSSTFAACVANFFNHIQSDIVQTYLFQQHAHFRFLGMKPPEVKFPEFLFNHVWFVAAQILEADLDIETGPVG